MRFSLRRLLGWLVALLLVGGPALLILWQGQNISNWRKLHNYHPPSTVASLATQDTMTAYAKRMFYVNHPQITSDATTFRSSSQCSESEQTIVLGCYHSGESGIFIFNPKDPRLSGVQQVTAAHEMLHGVYEQLSDKDRTYVDGLLQDYYRHGLTDKRILGEIKLYQKTEPTAVLDEMHSVFGTEASHLPTALEQYYKRYFTNRLVVVNYGQRYQSEFDSRQAAVNADDAQLAVMRSQIASEEQSLHAQLAKINNDRQQLDQYRADNNAAAYNAGVSAYNQEVADYNSGVARVKSQIDSYNALVAERNSIAKALGSLQSELDTRLSTQSSQ